MATRMKRKRTEALLKAKKNLKLEVKLIANKSSHPVPCSKEQPDCREQNLKGNGKREVVKNLDKDEVNDSGASDVADKTDRANSVNINGDDYGEETTRADNDCDDGDDHNGSVDNDHGGDTGDAGDESDEESGKNVINSDEEEELCEYEKRRLMNIKRNQAMLMSLNIPEAASFLNVKEKKVPKKLKLKPKPKSTEPIRRSARISGKPVSSEIVLNTLAKNVVVTEERKSGPVNAVPENDVEEVVSHTFLNSLDILNETTKITTNIVSKELSCTESYKKRISKLRVRNVCKVIWNRITTMTFHPSSDKTIICAGDRKGNIAFWNVDATSKNSEIFVYRPHVFHVREISFHPTKNDLMSCGADGTFRRADFNSFVFNEVFVSDDIAINSFSYPYNTRETFLLAFSDGHMSVLDTREPKSKNTSHLCHTRAIKCLDCHPANEYLFCTSSADTTVAIWDLRRIKGLKSKLDSFEGHTRSVSSAFFSPVDGKYVLSTSWDDTVKVLEQTSSKLEMKQNFRHFNQTGRWLSVFKATWDPRNGCGFVIGSMLENRRIQFYHSEQKIKGPLLEMFNENFTTIASTNVFHPSKNIVASANSSGKVFLWSE